MTSRQEKLIENYVRTKVRTMLKENSRGFGEVKQDLVRIMEKLKDDFTGREKSADLILKHLIKIGLIDQSKFSGGTVHP